MEWKQSYSSHNGLKKSGHTRRRNMQPLRVSKLREPESYPILKGYVPKLCLDDLKDPLLTSNSRTSLGETDHKCAEGPWLLAILSRISKLAIILFFFFIFFLDVVLFLIKDIIFLFSIFIPLVKNVLVSLALSALLTFAQFLKDIPCLLVQILGILP